MTRFARSKGSKASNERVPEQATSWSDMKQQLLEKNKEIEESKKRKDAINQRNANYRTFLEEKEESERKKTSWADFPEMSKPKRNKGLKGNTRSTLYINDKETIQAGNDESSDDETFKLLKTKVDQVLNNLDRSESDSDAPPEEESAKKEVNEPVVKVKKPKQKKVVKIEVNKNSKLKTKDVTVTDKEENLILNSKKRKVSEQEDKSAKKVKKGNILEQEGKVKNKKGPTKLENGNHKKVKENLTEQDLRKIEKKKQKRLKQLEKKKRMKAELKRQKQEEESKQKNGDDQPDHQDPVIHKPEIQSSNSLDANKNNIQNKSPNKSMNEGKTKNKKEKTQNKDGNLRRKPFLPHKMFINGKELEIEYVEGFPVKKEDAARLKKLRKEMISKGLPRSEINIALKLERRKAEKAFTREKKKVGSQ